ncbi:MAG: hypothetical protein FD119_3506 [Stygiobacter sp.]|nr:MAG: hypothetical protein FD119_3506 [Stygiobacter sp.]
MTEYWDRNWRRFAGEPQCATPEWRRLELAVGLLRDDRASFVLDCGCGPGPSFPALLRAGMQVVGADSSATMVEHAIEQGRSLGSDVEVVRWDMLTPWPTPLARPFDSVLLMSVLPYIDDPTPFFAQLPSLIRPGGLVIATFPNILFDLFTVNAFTAGFIAEQLVSPALSGDEKSTVSQALHQLHPAQPIFPEGSVYATRLPTRRYNPLTIADEFACHGLIVESLRFMNSHAVPPQFAAILGQERLKALNQAAEQRLNDCHWREYFTCSTFMAVARLPSPL